MNETPRPQSGLLPHLAGTISAFTQYCSARLQLFLSESKDAALIWAMVAGLALGAGIILLFGYSFLLISVLFAIGEAADSRFAWIWIMFGASGAHLAAACGLGWLASAAFLAPFLSTPAMNSKKTPDGFNT